MSCTLRAALLVLLVSICASAQTRTLALYADPPQGLDPRSTQIMRAELQRLLAPAGFQIVWKSLAGRKTGENFDLVAVFSFEGSCALDQPVAYRFGSPSLADTSISNGHILPFFRVECPRLLGMFGMQVDRGVLGRAIARIAAHELYHIVAQTTDHQEKGIAKASFSTRDLTADKFDLDEWSIMRMQPQDRTVAVSTENSPAESAR